MTDSHIRNRRLYNQQITGTSFTRADEIVSWMCAMQAQEFAMAKWAIGLRLPGSTEADIDVAFNEGSILRTHVLRPTWHFVAPADIRWLLKLTGPRVHAFNSIYYKRSELDKSVFKKCNDMFIKTLQGGKQATRTQLQTALKKKNVEASGLRLALIMMQAELDGIICSGKREGSQFTYALIEERVPPVKSIDRNESLVLLAERYFTARGPATVNDFSWWSGLAVTECKEAVVALNQKIICEKVEGRQYYYSPAEIDAKKTAQRSFLMPDYDEYGIAYKDRSAMFDSSNKNVDFAKRGYSHLFIIDGVVAGTWKFENKGNAGIVETQPLLRLTKTKEQVLNKIIASFYQYKGIRK